VVLARLRALEPGARALAVRLALLGRVLPAELVTAVAGLTEDALLDAIDELVRTRVLVEEIADNGVRYRFAYDAIRNALSADLDERKRAGLHLELARRIERAFRDSRAELAHVLARHFRYAGVPARAVRYLMLSARGAASRGDLEGALKRLDDAAVILETGPRSRARASRALRLLLVRLDLLLEFGRPKEALERADPALAAQARGPLLMKAELLLRRAAGQFALGRFDEALASVGRIGRPMPSRSVAARALSLEGRTRMARGEYAKARAVLEAARDVARGAGLADIADELDATIGMALLEQGEYLAALERLEEALRRARAAGRTRPIVDIMGHIGLVHAARAADTAALACYREALELAEARGRAQRPAALGGRAGRAAVGARGPRGRRGEAARGAGSGHRRWQPPGRGPLARRAGRALPRRVALRPRGPGAAAEPGHRARHRLSPLRGPGPRSTWARCCWSATSIAWTRLRSTSRRASSEPRRSATRRCGSSASSSSPACAAPRATPSAPRRRWSAPRSWPWPPRTCGCGRRCMRRRRRADGVRLGGDRHGFDVREMRACRVPVLNAIEAGRSRRPDADERDHRVRLGHGERDDSRLSQAPRTRRSRRSRPSREARAWRAG
jgi:tetratricopeptide (TPR) repeat protein